MLQVEGQIEKVPTYTNENIFDLRCVETTPASKLVGRKPIYISISEIVGPQIINNYGKSSNPHQESAMSSGEVESSEKLGGNITRLANVWTSGYNDSSHSQELRELIKKYVQKKLEAT